MSSRRELILAAIVAALNAGRPADVPEADRDRIDPPSSLPAVSVGIAPIDRQQETVTRAGGRRGPIAVRDLVVGVTVWARGATTAALDPMLVWNTGRLVDSTLGGLASGVEEAGIRWEVEGQDADYRKATHLFRVTFATKATDAESAPG